MRVLVTAKLLDEVLAPLREEHDIEVNTFERPMSREELLRGVAEVEGLLCAIMDRIDQELLDAAPRLKMIANFGVGYDNIDIPAATARGIWVSNTPGVLVDATADLAMALILAVARRVVEGDQMVRAQQWKAWAPFLFLGTDVSGKTLGVIGLGQIGKAVAVRAKGFGMTILYHNRNRIDPREEERLGVHYASLEELLAQSDFVSLHVSLNPQSRGLIGRDQLRMMKRSAFLINVARGPVVDEQALLEALEQGVIAGAGLDVYENEPEVTPGLRKLSNVVLLPHVGSATIETRIKMGNKAVENLLCGLRGDIPPNCLNPEARQRGGR
ncbi:MAG: 2-hydroxyacid dehydrogenase [Desulfomonilaceae bacterium]